METSALWDEAGKDESRCDWRRSMSDERSTVEDEVGDMSSKRYVSVEGDTKQKGAAV